MGLDDFMSQNDGHCWQCSTDLCDKSLSSTVTVIGKRVAYHQAHDVFVPSFDFKAFIVTLITVKFGMI